MPTTIKELNKATETLADYLDESGPVKLFDELDISNTALRQYIYDASKDFYSDPEQMLLTLLGEISTYELGFAGGFGFACWLFKSGVVRVT